MAQKRYKQGPWPPKQDDQPDAFFRAPGIWERFDRQLAGPLRYGTQPGVGPRGGAVALDRSEITDMGMDRVTPREFDPMGTSLKRYSPEGIGSELVSRTIRGKRRD